MLCFLNLLYMSNMENLLCQVVKFSKKKNKNDIVNL